MSSADEMRSQSGPHAADAADDDMVVVDEETAVKEPGRGPWAPDPGPGSAAAVGTEPGRAEPPAGGRPGSMPLPAADEGNGASSVASEGPGTPRPAADEADGASPMAGGGPGSMPAPVDEGNGMSPPRAGAASMSARPSGTGPSALRDDRRWREIQGMFVDDPRDSVQRASDLIDTVIEEFLSGIRQRQAALASSWRNRDADTEVLRLALKDYRALWAVVRDMPAVGATGGGAAASAGTGGSSFGAGAGPGGLTGQNEPEPGHTPA